MDEGSRADYYVDRARHLVCVPYSRADLLRAADSLGVPRHWLHRHATHEHLDVPVRQVPRVLADPRVAVVSSRTILAICAGLVP